MHQYKGIPIRAPLGLHEACFEVVQSHVRPGARVLDIAAGAGAFPQRLLEAGYQVVANDIDQDAWCLNGVQKFALDLNHPVESSAFGAAFDLVVAMEVIEHLQNPTKLLQDCGRLLAPGGYVLLSTPNVVDIDSRLIFLRKGSFYHFSPQSYFATGHRAILPYWLLELLFVEARLEVVERRAGGLHRDDMAGTNIKSRIAFVIARALRPIMRQQTKGELDSNYLIYLLRNIEDRRKRP